MDWKRAEQLLSEMAIVYNKDNIRRITYHKEIFPLAFRFVGGERSQELYLTINSIYRQLIFHPDLDEPV